MLFGASRQPLKMAIKSRSETPFKKRLPLRGGRGGDAKERRVVESASASSSNARSNLDGDASYGRSEEEAEIDDGRCVRE